MKKVTLILVAFMALLTTATAQPGSVVVNTFEPYIGVGTTLSSGQHGYGGELGIYSNKVWYAVGVSTTDVPGDNPWFASFKAYYKVSGEGFAEAFIFGAANVRIHDSKALSFEPGGAVVFNVSKRLAPQVSLSFPTGENGILWRPLSMNLGLGLNVWLY